MSLSFERAQVQISFFSKLWNVEWCTMFGLKAWIERDKTLLTLSAPQSVLARSGDLLTSIRCTYVPYNLRRLLPPSSPCSPVHLLDCSLRPLQHHHHCSRSQHYHPAVPDKTSVLRHYLFLFNGRSNLSRNLTQALSLTPSL
jgi:hypothetical protein